VLLLGLAGLLLQEQCVHCSQLFLLPLQPLQQLSLAWLVVLWLAVVLLLELLTLGCKWLLLVRVPEPPEVVALQSTVRKATSRAQLGRVQGLCV
jgi:hypothetical protein